MKDRVLRWYRRALMLYPTHFREEHGAEILDAVARRARAARGFDLLAFWVRAWTDLVVQSGLVRATGAARAVRRSGSGNGRELVRDAGIVARGLARSPGFTSVAVLTLVVGIGANTLMFSVLNGVVVQPLSFEAPDRLVHLSRTMGDEERRGFAPFAVLRLARDVPGLSALAWTFDVESMALVGGTEPIEVRGQKVSTGFFEVLGVEAALGRTLASGEDATGSSDVVVLAHAFWRTSFGADPSVLGTDLRVDGTPRRIVGVMPQGFRNDLAEEVSIWIPRVFDPSSGNFEGWHSETVIGRMAPGVTLDALQAQLTTLATGLAETHPDNYADSQFQAESLKAAVVADLSERLFLLQAIAAAVLFVACANLLNLLLARANRQRVDLAIRTALGASRTDLARLHLLEGSLLVGVGCGLAVALTIAALHVLRGLDPGLLPRMQEIGLDVHVLLFTLVTGAGVTLVASLAPAIVARGGRLQETIRAKGRGRGASLRWALVAGQTGSVMALLLVAALLAQHFVGLLRVDPGFDSRDRWTVRLTVSATKYPTAPEIQSFLSEAVAGISELPGVDAAAGAATLPLAGRGITIPAPYQEGHEPTGSPITRLRTGWNAVTPGYFAVMGIPVLQGREFDATDDGDAPEVLILNRTLAEAVFGQDDPVGRIVATGPSRSWTVVGVVGDVRHDGLGDDVRPEMYQPTSQVTFAWPTMDVVMRTGGYPGLGRDVRSAVWAVDADQPVAVIQPVDAVVSGSVDDQLAALVLVGAFASVALLLGLLGIYGVVSYVTSTRTRELGIRIALGAGRRGVEGLVIRAAATPLFAGIVLGSTAGWLALSLVGPTVLPRASLDPTLATLVSTALALAGLAAAWLPARRAARADLVAVMRDE